MELPDYFGNKRSVEFDMNDPKAIRQAIKHLTPKGLQKKRKKKDLKVEKKPEAQAKFQNILTLIPKTTKNKKISEPKKPNGKNLENNLPKVQINASIQKDNSLTLSQSNLSSANSKPSIISTNLEKTLNSQKSTIKSTVPVNLKNNTEARFKVDDAFLLQIGAGGTIELSCPICNESNMFDPENNDKHSARATRQCDGCGALLRISLQAVNRNIFSDLKPSPTYLLKNLKKATTEIVDENQNVLTIYGLKIENS